MVTVETIDEARERARTLRRPLGFVPTMGALHAGHLRLVHAAREQCAAVVVSVFVNPTQFGPGEDLEQYPRNARGDAEQLKGAGIDVLFAPGTQTMYPTGLSTFIDVGDIASSYEGAVRPTHFRGVATIVCKLLHIVQPDVLFLGQKDAQQTAVVRKFVRDLNLPVRVEIVATVRDPDGLAMSSRNAYLSAEQRAAAPTLHAALEAAAQYLSEGADTAGACERARAILNRLARWEYLDVVDMETFAPLPVLRPPAFVIGAARLGTTRLIDNVLISGELCAQAAGGS